ncbi:MAG TPA: hypothetical protein VHT95_08905 [Vicinamibacterales bacterium]|nr:hypothetical protein [Vicinamibacterales bacterium]
MTMKARLTAAPCLWIGLALLLSACSSEPKSAAPAQLAPSGSVHTPIGELPAIDLNALLAHTRKLSSDEFEGRAPGTRGEDLAVNYLADQFKAVGLKPGNTDGSYFQPVPLVGITPTPAPLVFRKGGQ